MVASSCIPIVMYLFIKHLKLLLCCLAVAACSVIVHSFPL